MMSNWLRALPRALRFILAPALAVLVAGVLVACGGGGYLPSPLSVTDPRPLSAEFLSRKAVSYSPYREARSESDLAAEVFEDEEILQDLQLIRGAGIGVIRLFSSRAFADQVLRLIRTNGIDLKMMLGAYPNPVDRGTAEERAAAEADNQAELDEAIRLANTYSDIVLAVSVGNETMVYWSTHKIDPQVMGGYILKVRQAIKQPVTTDDNWAFWASAPTAITDVVDFAAVHTYPLLDTFYDPTLWEWRAREAEPEVRAAAMADAAIAEAKRQFNQSRAFLDRIGLAKMPMVIGETGWMAVDYGGDPALPFRVQAVNQKLYYDRLQNWVAEGRAGNGPKTMFYFQAFDEQWKQADDGWGLFTRDRKARCVVQALNAPSTSWVYDTSQSCADSAAVYWVEPVYNDPITDSPYTLFDDAVAPGLQTNPYESPTAGDVVAGGAPGEGSSSLRITPSPKNYGWGLFFNLNPDTSTVPPTDQTANLKEFEATGSVTFWVKTDYPGKIQIGIETDTEPRDRASVFVLLENGDKYGYCNTNTWCQVTIPVKDLVAANPKVDTGLVLQPFVIRDIFEQTGKAINTTGLPPVFIDGVRWVK
jgi:exo-beta-1,3-glucanase (GH17 family)